VRFFAGRFFAVDFFFAGRFFAVDLRAVLFLAVDFLFAGLFLAADFFFAGLTVAAFRQRLALRVAVALEGDVLFDEAFRAGAAFFLAVPPLLFRNSFHEELAENLTALEAGILTAAPVRGLRPTRAFRCVTENAPSSGHEILSPDRTPARSTSLNALSTRSASAFATPASLATLSRSSVLFNVATDSQVMKKYMTITQELWPPVKHFRDNTRSSRARR